MTMGGYEARMREKWKSRREEKMSFKKRFEFELGSRVGPEYSPQRRIEILKRGMLRVVLEGRKKRREQGDSNNQSESYPGSTARREAEALRLDSPEEGFRGRRFAAHSQLQRKMRLTTAGSGQGMNISIRSYAGLRSISEK